MHQRSPLPCLVLAILVPVAIALPRIAAAAHAPASTVMNHGRADPRVPRSPSDRPGTTTNPASTTTTDRPTDTWSTFVAFAVVDQNGTPLTGASRCVIDGTAHTHAIGESAIEITPVGAHARVVLELSDLAWAEAAP